MPNIIDAVKAMLKDHGYIVRGVDYDFSHTDIGLHFERYESSMSVVADGGRLAPLDLQAEGLDPVTRRPAIAMLAHASMGIATLGGIEYNLSFSIKFTGEASDG